MRPGRGLEAGPVSQSRGLELLTTDEVAEELRIPRKQVYGLIHDEGLPAFQLSANRYRVARADLMTWLASRRASDATSTLS